MVNSPHKLNSTVFFSLLINLITSFVVSLRLFRPSSYLSDCWGARVTRNTLGYAYNRECYYILACVNKLVRFISGSPARSLGAGNITIMWSERHGWLEYIGQICLERSIIWYIQASLQYNLTKDIFHWMIRPLDMIYDRQEHWKTLMRN